MMNKANAENWKAQRDRAMSNGLAKAEQKASDAVANNATKLEKARGLIIDRLIRAVERMPEDGGSRTRQMMKDEKGRTLTRDYDLLALVSVYEKLTRAGIGSEIDDDPVLAVLKRWDDAAGQ